jgi:hypothetical protein
VWRRRRVGADGGGRSWDAEFVDDAGLVTELDYKGDGHARDISAVERDVAGR